MFNNNINKPAITVFLPLPVAKTSFCRQKLFLPGRFFPWKKTVFTGHWQKLANPTKITSLLIHTQPFNGPFSGTNRVSRYQKGKTNLDFTKARDSEWQWHQLGHISPCLHLTSDR